jgi:hypothetical protein
MHGQSNTKKLKRLIQRAIQHACGCEKCLMKNLGVRNYLENVVAEGGKC